ncbi:accessory Sec system S-layer assembly protein [Parageobacillus toebii]|uniref:Accessory Sec system S-layer assembly protein n=1 Tax=Geobacillus sp. (strain WCH70) TaxID=471223 RepID=C5D877_GEOSW|nr:accessory Sec system S-layer assembly protein [Parageobacillus toebii]MED4968202.1 accessory Sec system S-layer assembly protein [Parageobacillus toebii]MED4988820.1 accessory Sec system S-layer assembly protein [Parageobacillus toebii]OQP00161.1 accessory Sec system S-layer assembly protein [Geobacillus sp. 44C]QNU35593.1 accessory Sec system S-layer assembly protein [Geobacillus sp. 44C]
MFPFFKKKKKSGGDTAVSAQDVIQETDGAGGEDVHTELSLHPSWNLSLEQQYVLRFLNNELSPLKPNQISLSGISLRREADGVIVSAFVRHSLSKPIKIGKTTLLLLSADDAIIARKEFDLEEMGELPAKSSRPWHFLFENATLKTDDIPSEGWKLAFELKPKHRLELEESWEKALPEEEKEKLRQLVDQLEPPKSGEVNFFGLQAKLTEEHGLHITVLIRNGSDRNIYLEQLPLQVEDATGEVIARGGFVLDRLEVKANTTKPWTFIFPKELIQKSEPDLSKWKISIVEQS